VGIQTTKMPMWKKPNGSPTGDDETEKRRKVDAQAEYETHSRQDDERQKECVHGRCSSLVSDWFSRRWGVGISVSY